jgi:hypothetical protein
MLNASNPTAMNFSINENCLPDVLTVEQLQFVIKQLPNPETVNLKPGDKYVIALPKKFKNQIKVGQKISQQMEVVNYKFELRRYSYKDEKNRTTSHKKVWMFLGDIIIEAIGVN